VRQYDSPAGAVLGHGTVLGDEGKAAGSSSLAALLWAPRRADPVLLLVAQFIAVSAPAFLYMRERLRWYPLQRGVIAQ
jgi:hypothetical protein